MSLCLLLIDDGREDYLSRCLASLESAQDAIDETVTVQDPNHVLGFAGAIERGWEQVRALDCDWVFHVEGDFTFPTRPPLEGMIALLREREDLAQVALKRQAVNQRELAAGGVVEADPDDFATHYSNVAVWTEHRRFFTTNPSVYPASLCELGWPQGPRSEGRFTHDLLDRGYSFALWGGKFDPPRVQHIGMARAGRGY